MRRKLEADEMGDTEEAVDKYIGAQLQLEVDGELQRATITERATDISGNKVGKAHNNSLFDTREFIVKFPDQSVKWYTVNQIVEAIYSQVDDECRQYYLLKEIIGHKKDGSALDQANGYWKSYNGNKTPKKTTRGWKLCVQWKDGESEWVELKDL